MRGLGRHATTLILVALAAAAAIYVLVVDRGSVSTDEAELRKKNLLEAFRTDEITELSITLGASAASGAPRAARLTRGAPDDAGLRLWRVEIDGQRYAADEQAVDQYLGTLEFATAERRVSEGASDRAALGLDAPRITVELVMSGVRRRVLVGGAAPTPPGASYADVPGRGIFVVTKQLVAALELPPGRFRSRNFVPYLSVDLAGLWLDGEGGARRFARAPWGGSRGAGFRFDAAPGSPPPAGARVSAPALDRALDALGRMQAEVFLSADEARRAASTRVTLTLVPSDPAKRRGVIDLGGACPGKADHVVAVRREPTPAAACVPASVLDPLVEDASRFVDLAVVAAPLDEISEIQLVEGERKLELARAERGWHLRAPEDRPLPADAGRALAQALLDVRATRLVTGDLAALGLAPPRATLRVRSTPPKRDPDGSPGERIETIEIGAEQGGVVHVRRLEDGAVAEVPADAAAALLPGELALRDTQIFDFTQDSVQSLRVAAAGRSQRLRRTDGGGWRLLEPTGEGLAADDALADDLAAQLGGLRAIRWAAADAAGAFGLSAPRLVIEAEVTGESPEPAEAPRAVRIEIGALAPNGSFARAGGAPAVFVAPAELEAAAGRLLLDRGVFDVPAARVTRVTLAPIEGKPVVVEASPRGFTVAGAEGDPASASRAAAIRDALRDLRAEGAVAVGKPGKPLGLDPPRLRVTVDLAPPEGGAAASAGPVRIDVGVGDAFQGTSVYYARRDGVDATYAIAQAKLRPLLDAAGVR